MEEREVDNERDSKSRREILKRECYTSVQWINKSIKVKYYVTNEAPNKQAYAARSLLF